MSFFLPTVSALRRTTLQKSSFPPYLIHYTRGARFWGGYKAASSCLSTTSMAKSELIFVTGTSGFLGSHIVQQLLEKGYRVRGVARGEKAEQLKATYASFGDAFEVVKISDLASDQFPEALVGVDGLLHLATPMPGRVGFEEQLQKAVDGTLNIVVQAEKAGVKKVVVTSSIATVKNMATGEGNTDKDWNPITKEYALASKNPMVVYAVSKTLAERALWDWADKHPHVDVTTLNPTFFFGPFTKYYPIPPTPAEQNFSTNFLVYNLLFKDGAFPPLATTYIDVRDSAAAHVAALSSPPTAQVGRKRIIVSSPTGWPVRKIAEFLAEQRPEVKDRLLEAMAPSQSDVLPVDWKRVEEVLGLKPADFKSTESTFLETVDNLLKIEEGWKAKGCEIVRPSLG
ncbi:Epimerase domain-containing protein [Mycena indigotica]|uniref:Epimerase domain-containing protein n=1 Tax=Mycena indigotica TaxID=2126181 RepID=A0A8H6T4F9_9AGAR|nr:Epimerase domain-containing protein [Mycena indigotica]KAF7310192.1 Epimerase domain-containing protein [Mycena indigotica]